MAVYPTIPTAPQRADAPVPTDIETWTEQAAQSLKTLSIASDSGVRGTRVSLEIDLDEHGEPRPPKAAPDAYRPCRKLLRRDSLERREALLKGKEGSRRRTRWENDRLLNNPWAQPPLPSDWEVHPTYPRHNVPYYLAPLWDQDMAARAEARKMAARKEKQYAGAKNNVTRPVASQKEVPKELREKLKKAKAAKGLLRDLEEQVRFFMKGWEEQQASAQNGQIEAESARDELDSSDEEIVFVGRNGKMRDVPPSHQFGDGEDSLSSDSDLGLRKCGGSDLKQERLVFDSPVDDRSAGFGRWLVHNIAEYYGLRTWSRTIGGDPARREAYVGLPLRSARVGQAHAEAGDLLLPRPLWVML